MIIKNHESITEESKVGIDIRYGDPNFATPEMDVAINEEQAKEPCDFCGVPYCDKYCPTLDNDSALLQQCRLEKIRTICREMLDAEDINSIGAKGYMDTDRANAYLSTLEAGAQMISEHLAHIRFQQAYHGEFGPSVFANVTSRPSKETVMLWWTSYKADFNRLRYGAQAQNR